MPFDVCFVGAGPASLSGAIELTRLVQKDTEAGGSLGEVSIAVIEKGAEVGHHSLSGAVVNPRAMRELFPDLSPDEYPFGLPVKSERVLMLTQNGSIKIPTPGSMHNEGNYVASICEIVRWLGEKAQEMEINVFEGFPADSLLVEGDSVTGVRTAPTGLDREGRSCWAARAAVEARIRASSLRSAAGSRPCIAPASALASDPALG